MKRITVKLTKQQFLKLSAYQLTLLQELGEKPSKQEIFVELLEAHLQDIDVNYTALEGV